MSVETALYPPQLNTTLPAASDWVSEGDDHLRLIKTVLKTTFPNVAGAVSASQVELSYVAGVTSALQTQLNAKGTVTGQAWSGAQDFTGATPTVPTLAQGTNTTGAASTAFVQAEWATRLPNYTAPITASSAELNRMVGVTSGVQAQLNSKGAIAGQVWTGVHDFTGATVTVPTKTAGDSTTAAASTAFVTATSFSATLPGQAGNARKFVTTDGTNAAWAFPRLIPQVITANTTAAPGYAYLIAANGITLTVPATFVARDAFAFSVAVGITAVIDWTTNKLKAGTPAGVMNVRSKQSANLIYTDNTNGFMEAA